MLTNLLVFLLLAGTSYAIYVAVDNAEARVHSRDFHKAFSSGTEGMVLFMASFQVSHIIHTFIDFTFSLSLSLSHTHILRACIHLLTFCLSHTHTHCL